MSHRPVVLTSIGIAGLLALTACSGGGTNGASDDEDTSASSSVDAEPVTIEHALGEADIPTPPERVVTLGQGSTETAIALGVVPVGMESYPWGADDTGYLPWVHEAVTEAGAELPELIPGDPELDIEAILALQPDLILAPWSGITPEQYELLTEVAPTVAYPEVPWTITWEQQIEIIADALWQPDAAEGLIDDIEQQFAEAAEEHPEYAEVSFSFIYNAGPGSLGVFFPGEQRVAMVSELGLEVDPVVDDLGDYEVEGTDSAVIGLENADLLADSDLLFTFYSDDANRAEVEAQPVYASIPAIARDSVVAPEDQPFVTGSSMINPLTVPWALERYVPMIDEAITKLD